MTLARAQVTGHYFSGLPGDVFTNTLYFYTGIDPVGPAESLAISDRLAAAYGRIDNYISPVVNPRLLDVMVYDMSEPEPRLPVAPLQQILLGPTGSDSGMPNEVAACLSYHGAYISGRPRARLRGRIYLGPLSTSACSMGAAAAFPRLNTNFINDMKLMAEDLSDPTNGAAAGVWVQYSPTDDVFSPIVECFIDNEFDTQRRRGNEATTRLTFPIGAF